MTKPKPFKLTDQLIARFTVCVDQTLYNKLTSLARRRGVARSELVREILANYMMLRGAKAPQRAEEHADA